MGSRANTREVALLRSFGLWRTVLARLRADWAVVGAAFTLLLCATTLLTAGTLYGDTVALSGVHQAVDATPAVDRSVVVKINTVATSVDDLDGPVRAELTRLLDHSGGEVATIVRTDPFGLVDQTGEAAGDTPTLVELGSFDGIERHASLVDGRWPIAGATPQEATLSQGAAAALSVKVGDHLPLVGRLDASLMIDPVIVGIWQADQNDPYWLGEVQPIDGITSSAGFTTIGPLVVPVEDLGGASFGNRRSLEWRGILDTAGLRLEDLDAVRADAIAFASRLDVAIPAGAHVRVATRLAEILAKVSSQSLVSRTGVLLLVLQFAVLAAYAITLVAGMLADRRRAETALLRSRGASTAHLAAMTIFEASLIAVLAAAAAPVLALLAVQALSGAGPFATASAHPTAVTIGSGPIVVDVLTAIACVIALTVPMLGAFGSIAGVRAAIARQAGRTLAQRLGLDLALVLLAGIGLWQLRLYGAPLTRNARGVLGIDPLLVAAPGIGLLAGAVLASRLIPRLAELAERVLQRGRGLIGAMAGRGLARRPLRYTRSALLLMLAAALGSFATANAATWTRSQADQAAYQAGADLRIAPSGRAVNDLVIGATIRGLDGVEAAMPVDRLTVESGRGVRDAPVLAVDAGAAGTIILPTPDADGVSRAALLAVLRAARPDPPGVAIPDASASLRIVLDPRLGPVDSDPLTSPADLALFPGIRGAVFIVDGDGRLYQLTSSDHALLAGDGQPIDIELPALATRPLRLVGIDIGVSPPIGIGVIGSVGVAEIDAAPATANGTDGSWTSIAAHPGDPGWTWQAITGGGTRSVPVAAADGAPWTVDVGTGRSGTDPIYGGYGSEATLRLWMEPQPSVIAAIAGRHFLEATGASVGDTVSVTFAASSHKIKIVGVVDTFPTLDPATAFLVLDGPSLAVERLATTATVADPSEWWIADGSNGGGTAADATAAAILKAVDPGAKVVSRSALEHRLLTDPVALGVIGVLGLGSIAAMLFAAIGFVAAAAISTRERLGEFALLRALGLSGRELTAWLWFENAFLLVIGVVTGLGLGAILAYVVLPISTLTSTGQAAVPSPVVELPPSAVVPVVGVAIIVFTATILVLRGQLLQVRIGDVLRGRDE